MKNDYSEFDLIRPMIDLSPGAIAQLILIIHLGFIVFIVGGQLWIMLAYHFFLKWPANRIFRGLHLACVIFVILQAWAGRYCPLTIWENEYRLQAGEEIYHKPFVKYWVEKLIYYEAPFWVFALVYSFFGLLVFLYFLLMERRLRSDKRSS